MVKTNKLARVLSVFLAILMVFGSLSISASAYQINSSIHSSQKATNYKYIKYWGEDGSIATPENRGWETFYKRTVTNPDTGKTVPAYCLEFGKDYYDNLNPEIKSIEAVSAWNDSSDLAKDGVRNATIYGYPNKYGEYGDAAYYATQVIIWEYMLGYRVSASSDVHAGFNGGYDQNNIACRFLLGIESKNYSDVLTVYRGILTDISNHRTQLNFGSDNLKLSYNNDTKKYEGVFTDKSGILSDYDVASSDSRISVSKSGNKLTISSADIIGRDNLARVTLQKKYTCQNDGVALFVNANTQTLIVGTLQDPQVKTFNVYTDNANIRIIKRSEDNVISGISFRIECPATGYSKTFTTNADGEITTESLPAGLEYIITEITPDRYVPLGSVRLVLSADNNSVQFNNSLKKGSLTIVKVDSEDGSKLAGAKFTISVGDTYDTSSLLWNSEIDDDYFETDENGMIFINNLSVGKYVVKEWKAPKGYKLSNTEYPIEIVDETTNITITAENEKEVGSFRILKYIKNEDGSPKTDNAGNRIPVKGATFEIYSAADNSLIDTVTTLNNGSVSIALPVGDYYMLETSAPNGLFVNSERRMDFSISDPAHPYTATVGNYEINAYINKVDANGNRLTGATFSVFEADANYNITNQTPIFSGVTESDKDLKLENLKRGYFVIKETKAPNGYALPENNFIANMSVQPDATTPSKPVVTFSDFNPEYTQEGNKLRVVEKEIGLTIHKVDENGNPLSNVIFELVGENSQKSTDINGNVTFTKLTPGKVYSFKEVKTVDGYYLDSTVYTFTADKYGNIDITNVTSTETGYPVVTIENTKTEFKIVKLDELDRPLKGAEFDLYTDSGTKVAEYSGLIVTDDNGEYVFNGLKEGSYYLVETKSPDGFVVSDEHFGFIIGKDAAKTIRITNTATSVSLVKTDKDTGEALQGVVFELYNDNDVLIGTYTTDAEGKILVEYEPLLIVEHSYYFVEKDAFSGYYSNDTRYEFSIDKYGVVTDGSGAVTSEIAADNVSTLYYIEKTDADTGEHLSGVVFAIYASDGTFKGSYTTDDNGKIELKKFDEGDYYAIETSFPDGFIHDSSRHYFSIVETNRGDSFIITNKKTSVTLSKVDLVNGEPVEGATIEIYNDAGDCVYSGVSDAEGTITVDYLPIGHYTFKETINPDGYVLNTGEYDFTINEDGSITNGFAIENAPTEIIITKYDEDGNFLEGATIGIYNSAGELVYTGITNELGEISVQYLPSGEYMYKELKAPSGFKLNETEYHFTINRDGSVEGDNTMTNESTSVTITKTDLDGVPLAGATIAIYNADGDEVFRDVTNEFGKISVFGLVAGEYTYKEIECPDGYVLDKTVYSFVIDENGNVEGDNVLVNIATSIIITKTNEDGKPIEGATIGIYNENDELLFTLITDKNGQIKVENLLSGKYYFKEILPAEGYEINEEKYEFEITRDGVTVGANSLVNKFTSVTILKTDENGKPLAGATIQVLDKDGNVVFEGVSDENGKVVVRGLKPGDYFIQETKAPKGYIRSTEKIPFTVSETGIIKGDFVIRNTLEPVPIPKTGDTAPVAEMTVLALVSGFTAVATLAYPYLSKKRKKDEDWA